MANKGDVFEHPVLGERIVVLKSVLETGGDSFQLELHLAPGRPSDVAHVHPAQKERLRVISGSLEVLTNGAVRRVDAGQRMEILPDIRHVYKPAGDAEAVVHVEFRPALEIGTYYETFFALAQAGKVSPRTGLPNLMQMAVLLHKYRSEIQYRVVFEPLQSVALAVLAGLLWKTEALCGLQRLADSEIGIRSGWRRTG
jgi:quercetin dioxygenase-like cupin family protein